MTNRFAHGAGSVAEVQIVPIVHDLSKDHLLGLQTGEGRIMIRLIIPESRPMKLSTLQQLSNTPTQAI